MAKDKKSSKAAAAHVAPKPAETKVKAGRVTKPAESSKKSSKEVAKKTAKEVKKKAKKEPTPPPESSSEDEDDTSASSASSESEAEIETKTKVNGKANGTAKAAETSDDSSSASDSEAEVAPKAAAAGKVNGAAKAAPAAAADSDDSSSASDSDEEAAPKANGKAEATSDDDSDDSSEASSSGVEAEAKAGAGDDSSDASSSSDEEEEEKPKVEEAPSKKRKAEDAAVAQTPKKMKTTMTVQGEEKEITANLFVGNLSWNVDEDWLTREFEEFGELAGIRIITDRESNRSKGFGYVEFTDAANAAAALEAKQGAEVDGRGIRLDFSQGRQQKQDGNTPQQRSNERASRYGDVPKEPSATLFVGNVSFEADNDIVREAFEPFGSVVGVRLPTDRETGEMKGFGYVEMGSIDEAKAAFEGMAGAEIGGRAIRLDYSTPRPPQEGGGGRGFGGGRGGGRGGRGGFDRGGRGGGRGGFDRGRGGRGRGGDRGGRGGTTNRGGFGDFSGSKKSFD